MRRRLHVLSLVFLVILGPGAITQAGSASTAGSTISGVVLQDTDGSGTRSPADRPAIAVVDLERRVRGEVAWFVSLYVDRNGRFRFTDVPPGEYAVLAYWPQAFVTPKQLPLRRTPTAEWGLQVQPGQDAEGLVFLVRDLGSGAPSPAEDRDVRVLPDIGTRSVADQVVPDIPDSPGLRHQVAVPPDARQIIVARLFAPSQTHVARRNDSLCMELPVTGGVLEFSPRFSYTCPPGARVGLISDYGPGRAGQVLRVDPPIEWRLPLPGEGIRVVTTSVVPPQVGDGGLR